MSGYLRPTPRSEANSRASSVFDFPQREYTGGSNITPDDRNQVNTLGYSSKNYTGTQRNYSIKSYLVISGGTGCNTICSAFPQARTCYVLPVTDDGGSSSEIIRVIGGPSIGDIRSRLIRLIPTPAEPHMDAIRNLLSHRFPANCSDYEARELWRDVVEGRSGLWAGIPADRKELIRGFLVYFESEVLRRAHKRFSFRNGSIGNYFLAASQLFFRSLPSAIFQFSSITGSEGTILPVLVTNHTVTIAAELENGRKIIGQCNISHPVPAASQYITAEMDLLEGLEDDELETSSARNFEFQKVEQEETKLLDSRIDRVFYINAYGQEIYPSPNPDFLSNLASRELLVYSCGSLWTSIIPCLALRGVATAIARSPSLKAKILLLNVKNDRETMGYTALDYVRAITKTLNRHDLTPRTAENIERLEYPTSAFITHLVYLSSTSVLVELDKLTALGVQCISVKPKGKHGGFDAGLIEEALDMVISSIVLTDDF